MNYQHSYHAGNFADVIKHCIMVALIQRLQLKEKPMCLMDTHAGAGLYDLTSVEAQKSQEYQHGILQLQQAKVTDSAMLWLQNFVKQLNADASINLYPGSPYILQSLLREHDRLIVIEKHPLVYQQVKANLSSTIDTAIHERDAYEALNALLPPTPRRGLVLIDPPYEDKQELRHLVSALRLALKRWPIGIFMIWYPLKASSQLQSFYRDLVKLPCKEIIQTEIEVLPDSVTGLLGCGLIIINPPFQFFATLSRMTKDLSQILCQREKERFECKRLKIVAK